MTHSDHEMPVLRASADLAGGGPAVTDLPSATTLSVARAPKADLGKRFIAVVIDAVIAAVVGAIPILGGIVGAIYMVVRDGLDVEFIQNRSLGKKVMGLRPVRLDGRPVDLEASFRRNWMFGIGALTSTLLYVPIIGWLLIPFVALISLSIGIYETYLVLTDAQGRRWGDRLADTKVIESRS